MQCCPNAGPPSSMVTYNRPVSSGIGVCRPRATACVVLFIHVYKSLSLSNNGR